MASLWAKICDVSHGLLSMGYISMGWSTVAAHRLKTDFHRSTYVPCVLLNWIASVVRCNERLGNVKNVENALRACVLLINLCLRHTPDACSQHVFCLKVMFWLLLQVHNLQTVYYNCFLQMNIAIIFTAIHFRKVHYVMK